MLRLLLWLFLLGSSAALGLAAWAGWALYGPLDAERGSYSIEIRAGEPFGALIRRLQATGLVNSPRPLLLYARLSRADRSIPSGEILLEDCCDHSLHLLRKLVAGRPVLYSWTLIEGWNYPQAMRSLRSHPKVVSSMRETRDSCAAAEEISTGFCLEGMLRPDTYHFAPGTTDTALVRRALDGQRDLIAQLWQDRAAGLPYESFYDAVRLASIVEKEASVVSERPQIAGVYVQRLRREMLLEADPTLLYNRPPGVTGGITLRELRSDANPYNTYRRPGLPPTPIAMPSQGSLAAAMNPDESGGYLFFVAAADGSGRHLFSHTLAEHRQKVRRQRQLAGGN